MCNGCGDKFTANELGPLVAPGAAHPNKDIGASGQDETKAGVSAEADEPTPATAAPPIVKSETGLADSTPTAPESRPDKLTGMNGSISRSGSHVMTEAPVAQVSQTLAAPNPVPIKLNNPAEDGQVPQGIPLDSTSMDVDETNDTSAIPFATIEEPSQTKVRVLTIRPHHR